MQFKPGSCCAPFVNLHGQPEAFVTRLFGGPAGSPTEFVTQKQTLADALTEAEACAHYRKVAELEHIYLTNADDLDNRLHSYKLYIAEFCGVSIAELEELGTVTLPN